jgi:hypothetical protein
LRAYSKQKGFSATPPSDDRSIGLLIVSDGAIAVVIGLIVMRGGFGWLGHLPGDLRIERPNLRVYLPFGSMLVVSLVLSAVSYILRRFL